MDCKEFEKNLNNENISFKNFDIFNFLIVIFRNKELFDSRFKDYINMFENNFNSNKEFIRLNLNQYQKMLDNITNPLDIYFSTDDFLTKYGYLCKKDGVKGAFGRWCELDMSFDEFVEKTEENIKNDYYGKNFRTDLTNIVPWGHNTALKKHCSEWKDDDCIGYIWDYVSNKKFTKDDKKNIFDPSNLTQKEKELFTSPFNNIDNLLDVIENLASDGFINDKNNKKLDKLERDIKDIYDCIFDKTGVDLSNTHLYKSISKRNSKKNKNQKGGSNNNNSTSPCPICLDSVKTNNKATLKKNVCRNTQRYHKECLKKLLSHEGRGAKCPTCREIFQKINREAILGKEEIDPPVRSRRNNRNRRARTQRPQRINNNDLQRVIINLLGLVTVLLIFYNFGFIISATLCYIAGLIFVFYFIFEVIKHGIQAEGNPYRYGGKSTRKNKKNLIKIKSIKISGGAFQLNDPIANAQGEFVWNIVTFFFRLYFQFCGNLLSRTGAVSLAGAWGLE